MPDERTKPYWQHWYEIIDNDSLRQGDIFRDLIVFGLPQDLPIPEKEPAPEEELTVRATWYPAGDWIVMSASCDLERGSKSYPFLLIGRVQPATPETIRSPGKFDEVLEVLKRGLEPTVFLLAEYPEIDPPFEQSFVTFRPHVTVPLEYLKRACTGPRLRLRPPFREQFGNWVGENISRVGIEVNAQIPKAKMTLSASKRLAAARIPEPALKPVAQETGSRRETGFRPLRWLRSLFRG